MSSRRDRHSIRRGYRHDEPRSVRFNIACGHRTGVYFSYLPHQRQPQSKRSHLGDAGVAFTFESEVEDTVQFLDRNASARVLDHDVDCVGGSPRTHGYQTALWRIADRIGDEILDGSLDETPLDEDRPNVVGHSQVEFDSFTRCLILEVIDGRFQQQVKRHVLKASLDAALDDGKLTNRAYDLRQLGDVTMNLLESRFLLVLLHLSVVRDRLDTAQHTSQRSGQIVAEVCNPFQMRLLAAEQIRSGGIQFTDLVLEILPKIGDLAVGL